MERKTNSELFRDIKKKMVILSNRAPFAAEVRDFLAEVEKKEWIYRNLKMEGSSLTAAQTEDIRNGEFVLGATVSDHLLISRLEELLDKMYVSMDIKKIPDQRLIDSFHYVISGKTPLPAREFRRFDMTLAEYGFTPAKPADIRLAMRNLHDYIVEVASPAAPGSEECIKAAAVIHDRIIEIFPYGGEDKILARAVMTYYLMLKGFPAAIAEKTESEYNALFAAYLKTGNTTDFEKVILDGISERLDLMMQLTQP